MLSVVSDTTKGFVEAAMIAVWICKQVSKNKSSIYRIEQESPIEKAFSFRGRKKHADFTIIRIINKRTLIVTEVKSGVPLILDRTASKMVAQLHYINMQEEYAVI